MIQSYRPRGPNDPKKYDIGVLAFREESHRDSTLMAYIMTEPDKRYIGQSSDSEAIYANSWKQQILRGLCTVRLRGAWALLYRDGMAKGTHGFGNLVKVVEMFHNETGMPYAWRTEVHEYLGGRDAARSLAMRSPDVVGYNLRQVIRDALPNLVNGSFREKGVSYE